jgi:CRP-like cAMP-binding protein
VFYFQKGQVKITVVSEQGKEAIVAVLGPDEFCGEGCLTGQARRMATATAMTECEIMRLEKAAIIRVLHKEPAFSEMFISHLLARTIRVEADLVDQLFNSSEKRLARALSPGISGGGSLAGFGVGSVNGCGGSKVGSPGGSCIGLLGGSRSGGAIGSWSGFVGLPWVADMGT